MSLFGGLFDAFDAGDEQRAEGQRFRALKKGYNRGDDLVQDYGGQERDQYRTAMPEIYSFLDKGVDQAAPYLQASRKPYQELFDTGMGGIDRYGDSLWGLINDPDSIYESQLFQSNQKRVLDEIARMNNRGTGGTGVFSGNHELDIKDAIMSGGLNYHKYLTGTMMQAQNPYFGLAQGGAAGLAGANTQLANLYSQFSRDKGNTAKWGYGSIADSLAGEGSARTNLALAKAGAKGNMIINNQTHQNNADAAGLNFWSNLLTGAIGAV